MLHFLTRVPCKIIPTYDDGGNKLHALRINKHDWLTDARCARRHSYTLAGGNSGGASFSLLNCASAQGYFSIRARTFSPLDERWASGRAGANAIINHFSYFPDAKTHRRELWQGARPPCCRVTPPFSVGTGDQFRLLIIVAGRYGKFTRFFMHRKWISHQTGGW